MPNPKKKKKLVTYKVDCRCRIYTWTREPVVSSMRCRYCRFDLPKSAYRRMTNLEIVEDSAEYNAARARGEITEAISRFQHRNGKEAQTLDCPKCGCKVELKDMREDCFEGDCGRCKMALAVVSGELATMVSMFHRKDDLTYKPDAAVPDVELFPLPPGLLGVPRDWHPQILPVFVAIKPSRKGNNHG